MVPTGFVLTFDCLIPPENVDVVLFQEAITKWCKDVGYDTWIEYPVQEPQIKPTKVDGSNKYWVAFKEAIDKLYVFVATYKLT